MANSSEIFASVSVASVLGTSEHSLQAFRDRTELLRRIENDFKKRVAEYVPSIPGFSLNGIKVEIQKYDVREVLLSPGSIKINFQIGVVIGAIYYGVGNYPEFKEGAEAIRRDVEAILLNLEYRLDDFQDRYPKDNDTDHFKIERYIVREEDELEEELRRHIEES